METDNERLAEVIAALKKDTRDHMQFAKDVHIERLPTPSLGLTRALNGGWGMGRMAMLWGEKSTGKSTFLLQQIALAQQHGKICALMDSEKSLDPVWARANGVNVDELIHIETGTVTGMVNDGVALMRAGVDVICADSLSYMLPATFTDKDGELKNFEDTGAIGGMARSLSPAMSQITYMNSGTLWLFVSQVRMAQKGSMYWGAAPMGGKAVDHAISQAVKLFASEGKDALIHGEVMVGDKIYEKPVGRKVTWTVTKDRIGPGLGSSDDYTLYFDGDHIGIDNYAEILDLAVSLGVVRKSGAWYAYDGENIGQGEVKTAARFRSDPELFESVKEELNGQGG